MINKGFIIKVFIIFVMFNILYFISNSSYAGEATPGEKINTDIFAENFTDSFNPNKKGGGDIVSDPFIRVIIPVVNHVLGIIQIIGGVIFVLCLAAAGLNGILATEEGVAEDLGLSVGNTINEYGMELKGVAQPLNKKSLEKIIRRATIGSFLLMGSSTIVRIVFSIVSSI